MSEVRGQLIGGVWLPEGEEHFVEMMMNNKKHMRIIDGKHTYQYHKLEAAMRFIPNNRRRVCIDVGSHVGLWGMHLVKLFDFVHGFEPIKEYIALWEKNISESSKYMVHNVGLGYSKSVASFVIPRDMTGNTHVVFDHVEREERGEEIISNIEIRTLDSYNLTNIDFIKIDVEGFELEVVKGARKTLIENKPFMIIEQKGNDQKFFKGKKNEALSYLRNLGMKDLKVISGDHIMGW